MLIRDPNVLPRILYAIGAAFLLINLQHFYQYFRFRRIQATALLTWGPPRPPLYRLFLWVGAVLAVLVLLYRWRSFARQLIVPEPYYGQARRLLRDKIAAHDIHFTGKTLDLGLHDERDDV